MVDEATASHSKGSSHSGDRQEHSGSGGQGRSGQGQRSGSPQSRPNQGGSRQGSGQGQRSGSGGQGRSGQGQRSGSSTSRSGSGGQGRSGSPQRNASQPRAQTPKAPSNPNAVAYIDENGERRNKVVVNKPKDSDQYDKGKRNKQQRTKESTRRQAMLNTHRINPFKYDMKQILDESAMDPNKASAFLASVIAKASRVSTREAKDFIKTVVDEGDLTKDEADRIGRLLDKYSRYR